MSGKYIVQLIVTLYVLQIEIYNLGCKLTPIINYFKLGEYLTLRNSTDLERNRLL